MQVYLITAYAIFVTFPLALAGSIYVRQQRVKRQIAQLKVEKETSNNP